MANKPIKIAILADASAATTSLQKFATDTDGGVTRIGQSMGKATEGVRRSSDEMAGGLDKAREGFDTADTRAMGFRDTITGVQDTAKGFGQIAKGDMAGGLLSLGMGVGDLASGMSNFLIPALQRGIGWVKNLTIVQRILNITMLTNPVFLVVAAIVVLVGIFILAYKKSETFRRIVDSLWATMKRVFGAVVPIVSAAIGGAVRWIGQLPAKAKALFSKAGSLLSGAGRALVDGFKNGISGAWGRFTGWIEAQVNKIPLAVRKVLGIASPSKVFARIGEQSADGVEAGWAKRMGSLRARIRGDAVSLASAGRSTGTTGTTSGQSLDAAAVGDPVLRVIVQQLQKATRVNGALGVA